MIYASRRRRGLQHGSWPHLRARPHRTSSQSTIRGREAIIIIFLELPYQVNKARLIERSPSSSGRRRSSTASASCAKESDKDGLRVVIELKRG